MTSVTPLEIQVLHAIVNNEFGDDIADPVYTWSVSDYSGMAATSFSGVCSSLIKKDLVWSDETGKKDDRCMGLTPAGVDLYEAMFPEVDESETREIERDMENTTDKEVREMMGVEADEVIEAPKAEPTLNEMVAEYNRLTGKSIKKFESRAKATKRLAEAREAAKPVKKYESGKQSVVCIETGMVYDDAFKAAEDIGKSRNSVKFAIQRGGKTGGLTFKYYVV